MGFVTLRKTGIYDYWKFNDDLLTLIVPLLRDGFGRTVLRYMFDPKYENEEILGDMAYVRFMKNNKIAVGTQYGKDYFPEIIIDRNNLKIIIERWEQLKKANVDEIALKRDSDKVYIIGRSLTEEEKKNQEYILNAWYKLSSTSQKDKKKLDEFQEQWRSFTLEELKQLEREFYIAAMDNESAKWDIKKQ